MRITELLENAHFNSEEFIKPSDDGNEIDFDLADDLIFYLNNDDDVYRKYLHPAIMKYIDMLDADKEPTCAIFKSAVAAGYKCYTKEYPIRELPDKLDPKVWKDVCKKIYDTVAKDMKDGSYDHT